MVLSVSTFNETGEQLEEGVRHVKQEVVPSLRGAQGLKTACWVVDREQGQRLSIVIWESADAMSAAMPLVAAAIKRRRDEGGLTEPQRPPDSGRRFEVFAQL